MKGLFFNRRSLRFQLTASILLVLIPCFGLSYQLIRTIAQRQLTRITEQRLRSEAEIISYGLREWGHANSRMLHALSFDRNLRSRDRQGTQALLTSLAGVYPHREWRFWTADAQPRLLAATGGQITKARIKIAEQNILKRDYFRRALAGEPSYSVIKSFINNSLCLMFAQPVFAQPRPAASSAGGASAAPPTGVLLSCLRLHQLGIETGLQNILKDTHLAFREIDFRRPSPIGSSFLLVSRMGHLLYPNSQSQNQIPKVSDYLHGPWAPIFRIVQGAAEGKDLFAKVRVGNDAYFVLLNPADSAWSTLLILNEKQAFQALTDLDHALLLVGFLSLAVASAAIVWQCGRIIVPMRQAGSALQRLSAGDFEIEIKHERHDELGSLLDHVNDASSRLKLLLEKEKAHAITQEQIETAREIQKDFLVSEIPSSDDLQMESVFLPAYEVGADWYDVIRIQDVTYFIVADVCDKGLPSALYMSVFRSLLRYGLLSQASQASEGKDPGQILRDVVTMVNDYMATNHGDSVMFATMFAAAIMPDNRHLYYLSAGHEAPMLSRRDAPQWLAPTGPALGLFAHASYGVGRLDLQEGDYLVAYTDGLLDARSPDNVSWGRQALERFMTARAGGEANAATVLDALVAEVQGWMGGSDQFDDLTVTLLRVGAEGQALDLAPRSRAPLSDAPPSQAPPTPGA